MSTMSERIKKVRLEASATKLTQIEFAEKLNISRGMLTNMEDCEKRLKNGIPDRILRHICEVFHVNYVWLTTGEGDMIEDRPFDSDALVEKYMANETELSKSIMKAFAKLPDEEWVKFRELVDRIKKEGGI